MVLVLTRTYFPSGTNGTLAMEGRFICNTIELPWKNNKKRVSCIPEGKYLLRKRYAPKFGWHLEVVGVRNRTFILFHPANNALRELNGCIAPVTNHSGPGRGLLSQQAFGTLKKLVYAYLDVKKTVVLIVQS
jgi:hypothetical protein